MRVSRRGISTVIFSVGVIVALVVAGVAGFFVGQGSAPVSSATTTNTSTVTITTSSNIGLQKIRIGWLPYADFLPFFMALKMGLFQKYGLDPVLVKSAGSGPSIEALESGQIDVGEIAPTAIINFAAKTGNYLKFLTSAKLLGQLDNRSADPQAVVVKNGETVKSPADFLGKTIVTSPLGGGSQVNIIYLLQKAGIDTSKLTWKEVPNPTDEEALQSGAADIASCIEPFCTKIIQDSVAQPVDYSLWGHGLWVAALGNPVLVSAYWTTPQDFQKNPDMYVRFVKAIQDADAYSYALPQVAIAATAQYSNTTLASNQKDFSLNLYHPYAMNDTVVVGMLQSYVTQLRSVGPPYGLKANATVTASQFIAP